MQHRVTFDAKMEYFEGKPGYTHPSEMLKKMKHVQHNLGIESAPKTKAKIGEFKKDSQGLSDANYDQKIQPTNTTRTNPSQPLKLGQKSHGVLSNVGQDTIPAVIESLAMVIGRHHLSKKPLMESEAEEEYLIEKALKRIENPKGPGRKYLKFDKLMKEKDSSIQNIKGRLRLLKETEGSEKESIRREVFRQISLLHKEFSLNPYDKEVSDFLEEAELQELKRIREERDRSTNNYKLGSDEPKRTEQTTKQLITVDVMIQKRRKLMDRKRNDLQKLCIVSDYVNRSKVTKGSIVAKVSKGGSSKKSFRVSTLPNSICKTSPITLKTSDLTPLKQHQRSISVLFENEEEYLDQMKRENKATRRVISKMHLQRLQLQETRRRKQTARWAQR